MSLKHSVSTQDCSTSQVLVHPWNLEKENVTLKLENDNLNQAKEKLEAERNAVYQLLAQALWTSATMTNSLGQRLALAVRTTEYWREEAASHQNGFNEVRKMYYDLIASSVVYFGK